MSRQPKKFAVAVTLAACTAGLLAACGSDDDAATTTAAAVPADTTAATTPADITTATDSPSTAAPSSDPVAGPDGGDPAALTSFCDAYIDVSISMSGEPDPALLSENIAIVDESVPAEIADSAKVMTEAVAAVLASDGTDFSPLESAEFAEAQGTVDPYVFENCEFSASIEVTGVDYGFGGIPETLTAGRVAMLFTNDGADAHEIAVMRRNDGVTEPFEELLSLPETEAMGKVTPIGGAVAPSTGSQALLVGDFEPGDYIAICFVPVGTTIADGEMTEGTGDPHFMHGMQQEFTVTA